MYSECDGIYMPIRWTALFIHSPPSDNVDYVSQHNVFNQIKFPPPLYTNVPIYIQMTHELILNLRTLKKASVESAFAWHLHDIISEHFD